MSQVVIRERKQLAAKPGRQKQTPRKWRFRHRADRFKKNPMKNSIFSWRNHILKLWGGTYWFFYNSVTQMSPHCNQPHSQTHMWSKIFSSTNFWPKMFPIEKRKYFFEAKKMLIKNRPIKISTQKNPNKKIYYQLNFW